MSGLPSKFGALALSALAVFVPLMPAAAQSVQILGEHNAWTAYATPAGANRICFILARPSSATPPSATDAYFYITHRPDQAVRSEINIVSGYTFASGSQASLTVGAQSFALFTEEDAAWLADPAQTEAANQAIRAGSTMQVAGTNASGEAITQSFSLMGATAASREIDTAC